MSTVSHPQSAGSTGNQFSSISSRSRNVAELVGRVMLSVLFLLSGIGKITAFAATAGYMAAFGVPASLLPLVIVAEVLGALAIIAGWQTRIASLLLASFTLLS